MGIIDCIINLLKRTVIPGPDPESIFTCPLSGVRALSFGEAPEIAASLSSFSPLLAMTGVGHREPLPGR